MANKTLFTGANPGKTPPPANTQNEAGGIAYSLTAKGALAQLASTGCLNDTYYSTAQEQLENILKLCDKLDPEFIAKTAVYSRQKGFLKDMPALLAVILSIKDVNLLKKIFNRVIDNGKMMANFVQILRSGATGRKSLGSAPKKLIQNWLASRSPEEVYRASVGMDPSMGDVIKLARPKAMPDQTRHNLYAYLMGKDLTTSNVVWNKDKTEQLTRDGWDSNLLPPSVKAVETYREGGDLAEVPSVDFRLLTSKVNSEEDWKQMAKTQGWHATRMNLNTYVRHGVFNDPALVKIVADKLRDEKAIKKSKVFPYQLLITFLNTRQTAGMPQEIINALQDAMEIAVSNVPAIDGKVYIFPDVSGSMSAAPVTGFRDKNDKGGGRKDGHKMGNTTEAKCIQVASLITAAFLRNNEKAEVIPFEGRVVDGLWLNPRDTVMTNAEKLGRIGGGSTNCSAPLQLLNNKKAKGDLIIYVSDMESWVDSNVLTGNAGSAYSAGGLWYNASYRNSGTATAQEWMNFKARNPKAKMVCLNLQAHATTQAIGDSVLNVGGFSDSVFELISRFYNGEMSTDFFVNEIEAITL